MKKSFLVVALSALSTCPLLGAPSSDNARFFFVEEPVNPRTAAMGSAGTALDGIGFFQYNPASPALLSVPQVSVEYGRQAGDLAKSLIGTAWKFRSWFAGAALLTHSTDFQEASEQGVGAMSSDQMFAASVCGGFILGRFANGHSVQVLHERIGDYAFHAFSYSTGAVFEIMPEKLTAGAALLNYVRLDTVAHPWYRTFSAWRWGAVGLPRYVRAGAAWRDTLRRFEVPYTIAADAVYSDVYDRLMVPVGAEAWVLPSLAVRLGKWFNHPSEIIHFGAGVRWGSLACDFDYGVRKPDNFMNNETQWLLGLTYSLHRPRPSGKKAPAAEEKQAVPAVPASADSVILFSPQETLPRTKTDSLQTQPPPPSGVPDTGAVPQRTGSIAVPPRDSLAPPPAPIDTLRKTAR